MQATQSTTETWLPVPGHEGSYEVSDHGRVRSLDRRVETSAGWSRLARGRVLRATVSPPGYPFVQLSQHESPVRVHVLVAAAFLGPRPEGMDVCHGNGDKLDNRLENLRYDTHQANAFDTVRHGRNIQALKTHCPAGHEYTPENTYRRPGTVNRYCRACKNAWMRADRAKRRENSI